MFLKYLFFLIKLRKVESSVKHRQRLDKINKKYVPVSELNDDEKCSRRAVERAKKQNQRKRKCKKIVSLDVEDEEPKSENELSKYETDGISDYEKLRQANIQERNQKMKTLELKQFFN